jgi:hypothetical protein
MLNNLHVWVFEKKFRIKELLSVLVISKKPHRTVEFHENRKGGPKQVFGRLFYFYNLGSRFQDLDRWTDGI